jgi:hypothetical protein
MARLAAGKGLTGAGDYAAPQAAGFREFCTWPHVLNRDKLIRQVMVSRWRRDRYRGTRTNKQGKQERNRTRNARNTYIV